MFGIYFLVVVTRMMIDDNILMVIMIPFFFDDIVIGLLHCATPCRATCGALYGGRSEGYTPNLDLRSRR
jgi:hypothetical protein